MQAIIKAKAELTDRDFYWMEQDSASVVLAGAGAFEFTFKKNARGEWLLTRERRSKP